MASNVPGGVVTLDGEGGVDDLLRRAVARVEAVGLDVLAVIDHSGEAAEAGVTIPDTKLVIFGSRASGAQLVRAHPLLALDLPLKLLISGRGDGGVNLSFNVPSYLARRYGLTDVEAEALRIVETIAEETRSTA
jgi:uncharacterized protein (DUF302 family)